jgi:hypothetical protein
MRQRTNFSMGMGSNSKGVPSRSSTHLGKQRPNSPKLINFKKRGQLESSLAGMQMKSVNVEILCILRGLITSKNVTMRHEKPQYVFDKKRLRINILDENLSNSYRGYE